MHTPNLFIVGAQKAGTTSLANILSRHKDISIPPEKELNHFDNPNWRNNSEKYLQRYSDRGKFKYRMDATPGYLVRNSENNPAQNIFDFCKNNPKLLCLLRHPVRRAIAAFYHHFRMGRINSSDRIRDFSSSPQLIIEIGFYTKHLENYISIFGHENFKILIFEDFILNQGLYMESISGWLSINPNNFSAASKKVDTNAGIKLVSLDGKIQVADPEIQLKKLRETNSYYKKMPSITPPVVEQKDIDFLNAIYTREIQNIKYYHPKASAWEDCFQISSFPSS